MGEYYIRFAHGVVPQMTQICTDGYATGCYLWDSEESEGGYYIRFVHGVVPQMTQIYADGYATGCYL